MPRIFTPQWRNSNQATHYPFSDAATFTATDGAVIPEGIFIDASLYPVGGVSGLFLSSIIVTAQTITIFVGNEGRETLCSGSFSVVNAPNLVTLTDAQGAAAGVLVSQAGQLAVLQALGPGTHTFLPATTQFCASVCVPTPELGVRGVLLEDGTLFSGDLWLVGDDGVVLAIEEITLPAGPGVPALTVPVVTVSVVGDPLSRRRLCSGGSLFSAPALVRQLKLTGPGGQSIIVAPDAEGGIVLTATSVDTSDTVLRLSATTEGLEIAAVGAPTTS